MTRVKVPKVITLGSHDYAVLLDESQEDGGCRGTSKHPEQEILISLSTHPQQKQVTLLHEVIHNVCVHLGVNAPESDVVVLAEGIGQFLFRDLGIQLDWTDIPTLVRNIHRRVPHKGQK